MINLESASRSRCVFQVTNENGHYAVAIEGCDYASFISDDLRSAMQIRLVDLSGKPCLVSVDKVGRLS